MRADIVPFPLIERHHFFTRQAFTVMTQLVTYTLFHEFFRTWVFSNIIGLPGHRNKRKSVLEITKMYYL